MADNNTTLYQSNNTLDQLNNTVSIIYTVLFGLIILTSAIGNTLLIYIVWKRPEVRSLNSFMFLNMATADLLVTASVMPWSIASLRINVWEIPGFLGEITCRGLYYLGNINLAASILCLVIMAIDRYYAVFHPFSRHGLWFRKAKLTTPVIWIMAMILMSITCVFHDLHEDKSCVYNFVVFGSDLRESMRQFFFFYLCVIIFIIPLVIVSVLYAKIAYKVWFHEAPGCHLLENQRRQELKKKRVIRMLIVIVVTFAICWLPSQVFNLYIGFVGFPNVSADVMYFVYWCAYLNSAINPWLYLGMSNSINVTVKRVVSNSFRKKAKTRSQRLTQKTRDFMRNNNKEE